MSTSSTKMLRWEAPLTHLFSFCALSFATSCQAYSTRVQHGLTKTIPDPTCFKPCSQQCPKMQVFCHKHPELAKHFVHAHAAIFTSAASTTLGCCSLGRHAVAAEAAHQTGAAAPNISSSSSPARQLVQPSEAAATVLNTHSPRSITALVVDRVHGKTVKQRISSRGFCDVRYVAQLLLQIVPCAGAVAGRAGVHT